MLNSDKGYSKKSQSMGVATSVQASPPPAYEFVNPNTQAAEFCGMPTF